MDINPMTGTDMPNRNDMAQTGSWWIILGSGILSVIAGILILEIPWTLQTLAYFIGAILIVRGILQAIAPPSYSGSRILNITVGIISLLVGAAIIVYPQFAAFSLVTLALFIGAWFIVSGVVSAASAIANRDQLPYWGLSLVGGILSVTIGIFALYRPIATLAVMIVLVGIWSIVVGTIEIGLSFEARRLARVYQEEQAGVRRVA